MMDRRKWLKFVIVCTVFGVSLRSFGMNTTTVQVIGIEQSASGIWDGGSVTLTFNGHTVVINYGQFSTNASVASGLAATFAKECSWGVKAKASGSMITLQSPSGIVTPGTSTYDSSHFAQASFGFGTPQTLTTTATTLSSSSNPSTPATSITFVAAVSPVTAAGSVRFRLDNQSDLGTSVLVNGIATVTAPSLSPGTHTIKAIYSGDAADGPSNSNTVTQKIITPTVIATQPPLYSFHITDASGQTGYAANGNILNYVDSVTGRWTATYDNLNRLTSHFSTADSTVPNPALPVGQTSCWQYDAFGNMTIHGSPSSGICPALGLISAGMVRDEQSASLGDNRLIGRRDSSDIPVASYTYDAAGQMLNNEEKTLTSTLQNNMLYDAAGRVCATRQAASGQMTGYLYDAGGARVAKGTLTQFKCDYSAANFTLTSEYIYGASGDEMTEVGANGDWVHTNVGTGGGASAVFRNDGPHYILTDWLGSKRQQLAFNGQVENTWRSLPFGDDTECVSGCSGSADANEHKFTGKERDSESGMDYFGSRYLTSSAGRWLSPDSLGTNIQPINPQAWNLYAYSFNNPLRMVDPNGEWPTDMHNYIIDSIFRNKLSDAQRAVLKDASLYVDSDQSPEHAHRHAQMSGGSINGFSVIPTESREQAIAEGMEFIQSNLDLAVQAQLRWQKGGADGGGVAPDALWYFGQALHTVTDAESPWHDHFKTAWAYKGAPLASAWHGASEWAFSSAFEMEESMAEIRGKVLWDQFTRQVEAVKKDPRRSRECVGGNTRSCNPIWDALKKYWSASWQ